LVFHTYTNEMHGSRSKIPSKKSRPYIYTHTHDVKYLVLLGAPYIYDISRLRVNSKCTCGCLIVDMYRMVLYFVSICFIRLCVCVCVYICIYTYTYILLEFFLVKIANWFRWTNVLYFRLWHDSGHRELGSVPGQAMWNLWLKK
jgi:hypothetical protein